MSSLVAYGASDDSDQSDTEDNEPLSNSEKENGKDQISDDEEYQAVSSSTLITDFPLNNVSDNPLSFTGASPFATHKELPPPQKREDVAIEETELEEEVRQKPSELADAPKPPPKRAKQTVKITIPSLDEIPEDEDDCKRKAAISSSSAPSSLFSLLPAPIHSAKKEINRPLIPHSLAKKPQPPPPKPAVQAKPKSSSSPPGSSNSHTNNQTMDGTNKRTPIHSALIGYDSDDDDDEDDDETGSSNNFFSLGSSNSSSIKKTDLVSTTTDNNKSNVIVHKDNVNENSENVTASETVSPQEEEEEEVVVAEPEPEPGLTNDSPLDFGNASRFSSWSSASSSYLGGFVPNRHAYHTSSYLHSNVPQSSVQYNMIGLEETEVAGSEITSDDLQQVMNDKEFQKLHGKRKRGMEEAISFVDAKVDDYVDPSELSKHITEESEYSSKKNKDDAPTSQQKRKKQITYLAFQAKEKELELKNTWSQNRLTKRQTQAKYGF